VMRDRYKGRQPAIIGEELVRDNASEEFMLKDNQVIERELANADFSVELLAQEMLMSRSSLYARFREVSGGQSVGQYIADYRMRRAKELLTGTRLPLSEIAIMLGYSSQRYFSSAFKQRAGVTPSAFRASGGK
ncbi:MAG: helix-turn-helix transcriptional regulator, partial [Muribaculaceae bacterium]|nr:helix-turn-helix transcriptional regulator [Muribaculaceae bacterium]